MSTVADLADARADGVLFAVALAFRSTPTHACFCTRAVCA